MRLTPDEPSGGSFEVYHAGGHVSCLEPSYSGAEFFARTVDPIGWAKVNLLMTTGIVACFDASGKTPSIAEQSSGKKKKRPKIPDSRIMAVAGFASQAGVWAEFDAKWSAVLTEFGVPYFHAGDFARSKPPFDGSDWRDERRRRGFQFKLMETIQGCGLRKFGNLLWVPDRHKAQQAMGLGTDSTASPYVLCCRSTASDFISYALGEGQRENVAYVFEKGDEEDRLRAHFKKHSFHDPEFRWNRKVEKKGIVQTPFLGLQAAGWIVWEYYVDFHRGLLETFQHPSEGRWALREFQENVVGHIKLLYKSGPLINAEKQVRESLARSMTSMTESIRRLEAAKREGASLVDSI